MRKSDLFKLISAIKNLSIDEEPIIVGSQSAHAVTNHIPEIAKKSIECDFLFRSGSAELREMVNRSLGVFSVYQDENGFYADAIGLATVVLPVGWDSRLNPLHYSTNRRFSPKFHRIKHLSRDRDP